MVPSIASEPNLLGLPTIPIALFVSAVEGIEQRQNLAIEGDIVVESGTYLIENVNLNLTGRIIASNDATVIIRNATLFVTTQGYIFFRDAITLANRSRLSVQDAIIDLEFANGGDGSYITVGDESIANISDSELYGNARIVGRQNSEIYVNRSILRAPWPADDRMFGAVVHDNSTARIQDSELGRAAAEENSSIYIDNSIISTGVYADGNTVVEIENSFIGGYVEISGWPSCNSTLRILNSTANSISFAGLTLNVEDSRVTFGVDAYGNSTARLTRVSASSVTATDNAAIWLFNSYSGAIRTRDQGMVYVGLNLGLFGTLAVPYTWLPILQGIAVLAAIAVIIALLVGLNRRWKRRQQQKLKEQVLMSSRSQLSPSI